MAPLVSPSPAGPSSTGRCTRRPARAALAGQPGRTVSSACSSATPASKASSPRKPAAMLSASRRCGRAAERREKEVVVRDRVADLERRVPCGEHRQVVLVELVDGLGVVHGELVVGDLVDPRAHQLAEQLPARLWMTLRDTGTRARRTRTGHTPTRRCRRRRNANETPPNDRSNAGVLSTQNLCRTSSNRCWMR